MATIKGRRFSGQEGRKPSGVVGQAFDMLETGSIEGKKSISAERATLDKEWEILEIPLSLLSSFPGNRVLRLSAIPQLAQSIERTRLIHPIAVAKDEANPGRYIVLSGHRRTEAYKLLNEKYANGKYSKIKAIVVSYEETKDLDTLKRIWIDANLETRQLSLADIINHIDMFLLTINGMSEEDVRVTINQMKGLSLSEDEFKTLKPRAKMINRAEYIHEQFKDLDIAEWSVSSIRQYLSVADKGIDKVRNAFLESKIPLYAAYDIANHNADLQSRLLDAFLKEPMNFTQNKNLILGEKKRIQVSAITKHSSNLMNALERMDRHLDVMSKKTISKDSDELMAVRAMREFLKKLVIGIDRKMEEIENNATE